MPNERVYAGSKTCAQCSRKLHVLAHACPVCGEGATLVASIPQDELPEILNRQSEARSLVDQSMALMQQGQFNEAEQVLKRAQEINPHNSAAFGNLGGVYFEQGRFAEAIPWMEKALSLNPTFEGMSGHLATAKQKVGEAKDPDRASAISVEPISCTAIVCGPECNQLIEAFPPDARESCIVANDPTALDGRFAPSAKVCPAVLMYCCPWPKGLRRFTRKKLSQFQRTVGIELQRVLDIRPDHAELEFVVDSRSKGMVIIFKSRTIPYANCCDALQALHLLFTKSNTIDNTSRRWWQFGFFRNLFRPEIELIRGAFTAADMNDDLGSVTADGDINDLTLNIMLNNGNEATFRISKTVPRLVQLALQSDKAGCRRIGESLNSIGGFALMVAVGTVVQEVSNDARIFIERIAWPNIGRWQG